jgi:iron(III) transport system substrate-binding protein
LVGVTDPSIGPTVASLYQLIETPEQAGPEYLDELMAGDNPKIYPGSNPQVTALAAGEIIASLPVPVAVAASIKGTGAPIEYQLPPETPSIPSELAVVKSAKHPNAAQVFANWLLSEAGQKVIAEGGFIAVREDTSQTIDTSGAELVEIPQITTEEFQAFLQRWNELLAQ